MQTFKIATFNIQLGVKVTRGYWQYLISSWKYFFGHTMDFQKINRFVEREKIDIIAFTEVGERLKTGADVLNDDLISALSGFNENVQANYRLWKIFKFGNAISARFKIIRFKEHYLSDKKKGRLLCEAVVQIGDKSLTVITTHLSLIGKNGRKKQIDCIVDIIKKIKTPFVLAGDFNTQNGKDLQPIIDSGTKKISFKTRTSSPARCKRPTSILK